MPKTLIMREIVSGTERVCTVEYAATPISALSIMPRNVSGSRLSPISTTSGAVLVLFRVAVRKLFRCSGMVLWEIGPRGSGMASKSNSMGASYVLTWRPPFSMISRRIAASNVLLPLPMTPVTSTRPLEGIAWSRISLSTPSSANEGGREGIERKTIFTPVE